MTEQPKFNTAPLPIRLRVEDYLLLDGSGAFARYARTELIEGAILAVNAEYSRHLRAKSLLYRRIADACDGLPADIAAWVDGSVAIGPESAPKPDILLTRDLPDDGLVPVELVVLLVEVADSTLDFDLGTKAALYARAAVPEYWVADLAGRVIHQLWSPEEDGYTRRRVVPFGDPLTSSTIEALTIETDRF